MCARATESMTEWPKVSACATLYINCHVCSWYVLDQFGQRFFTWALALTVASPMGPSREQDYYAPSSHHLPLTPPALCFNLQFFADINHREGHREAVDQARGVVRNEFLPLPACPPVALEQESLHQCWRNVVTARKLRFRVGSCVFSETVDKLIH